MRTPDRTSSPSAGRGTLPLGWLALVSVALFGASLLLGSLIAGATFPSPFGSDATVLPYITEQATALQVQGVLQFASAVVLAIFAAAVAARLQQLGSRSAAAPVALAGGVFAAVFGAVSALLQWALSQPAVGSLTPLARTVHFLTFITGGPGNVVGLGVLVLGLAAAGWYGGLLPRWLSVVGLVIAVIAGLSGLVMRWPVLGALLPIARFPGLLWLIAAGFTLPRRTDADVSHRERVAAQSA